jgi:F-type H+-transporting ATPase subunit delta
MQDTRVAIRYAKSFLGLVAEKGGLEEAYRDMSLIHGAVTGSRELRVMLKSPIITADKKVEVLNAIFKGLGQPTQLFLELLTRKGREGVLGEVTESFIRQYKTLKGITTAKVVSAAVLTEEMQQRIVALVTKEVGGVVELELSIDPELIGGFVLSVGDRQLDNSILSKVNAMRQEFGTNLFVKRL